MWNIGSSVFHVETTLADGRRSVLIDTGSVSNFRGDAWAREIGQSAIKPSANPTYNPRTAPINVCGVGEGSQQRAHDSSLPITMRDINGCRINGDISLPTVRKSTLPGLMGLRSLQKVRAIIDFQTLRMYWLGLGDYDLAKAMPPGTVIQLELGPIGHLRMPCCEYDAPAPARVKRGVTLLATKTSQPGDTKTEEAPL